MKLIDFAARLAPLLGLKMGEVTELLRALKEGSEHFKPERLEPELRDAIDEERWADVVQSRSGPGGGLPADPFRAAFLVLAIMLEKPRRKIAEAVWQVWHLPQEGSVYGGWGEDWRPTIKYCPLTKVPFFGEALKAVVGDGDLAGRVKEVRASDDEAVIIFDDGQVSRFVRSGRKPQHLRRDGVLDGYSVGFIAQILQR